MARGSYTAEQKAKACDLLRDPANSYANVRDKLGIPVGTLAGWARAAGIERADSQKSTKAATAARMARIEARRGRLKEKLLKHAESFADVALDYSKGPRKVEQGIFIPAAKDVKDMMTAAAIALDKFRLEMGEATSRVEHSDLSVASKAKAKVDELAERRQQKSA